MQMRVTRIGVLGQLIAAQLDLLIISTPSVELKDSLLCSRQPDYGPYSKPVQSCPQHRVSKCCYCCGVGDKATLAPRLFLIYSTSPADI
jgi:hypothetical protein